MSVGHFIFLPPTGQLTTTMADLVAVIDGSAAPAGTIGEVVTASQVVATTTGVGSTGTWGSPCNVVLTAGAWWIYGVAGFAENGAVLTRSQSCGLSASSTGAGIGPFDFAQYQMLSTGADDLVAPVSKPLIYDTATGGAIYLNTRFWYTSGTPQHYGYLQAIRVR